MRWYRRHSVSMILTLALVASSSATSAAEPISQQGKIGPYVITDSNAKPGVTCTYDASGPGTQGNDIDIMEPRVPRVFARNRSGNRDQQIVGVKFFFQRSVNLGGSGGWVTAKATKVDKKTAYDDKAAAFVRRSWLVPIEETYHFRVLATISWYKPGTSSLVQGSTKQRYVYYRVLHGGPQGVELDRCLPEP